MKTQKTLPVEEPAWKRRQKEARKADRKSKLWTILVFGVLGLAVVFLISMSVISSMRVSARKDKVKPIWGVARVIEKKSVRTAGVEHRVVTFHLSYQKVDWEANAKDFDLLKKGEDVKVQYTGDTRIGNVKIVGWEKLNLAPLEK